MSAPAWKMTPQGREPLDERMQRIVAALRDMKRSYESIAAEFGISRQRVEQIRKYAGIERRREQRVKFVVEE